MNKGGKERKNEKPIDKVLRVELERLAKEEEENNEEMEKKKEEKLGQMVQEELLSYYIQFQLDDSEGLSSAGGFNDDNNEITRFGIGNFSIPEKEMVEFMHEARYLVDYIGSAKESLSRWPPSSVEAQKIEVSIQSATEELLKWPKLCPEADVIKVYFHLPFIEAYTLYSMHKRQEVGLGGVGMADNYNLYAKDFFTFLSSKLIENPELRVTHPFLSKTSRYFFTMCINMAEQWVAQGKIKKEEIAEIVGGFTSICVDDKYEEMSVRDGLITYVNVFLRERNRAPVARLKLPAMGDKFYWRNKKGKYQSELVFARKFGKELGEELARQYRDSSGGEQAEWNRNY